MILKQFFEVLTEYPKVHFYGQQAIGKSHNLAIFSLLLRMSKEFNVIYLHTVEFWIEDLNPLDYLLQQLKLTLPTDLHE
jgi:DNA replication protein DnaC